VLRRIPSAKKGRQRGVSPGRGRENIDFIRSPFRRKTLEQLAAALGDDRKASVSREISKKFEETVHGTLSSVADHFRRTTPRGEFVIVVAGASLKDHSAETE
jgi:16S rRNA (cytidine1402-2'-O)-methyltransferase